MMAAPMADPSDRTVAYEQSDAPARLIAWLAAAIAAFLIMSPLVLQLLFPDARQHAVIAGNLSTIAGPRLQIDPARELAELRQAEAKRLSSYGWVDAGQRTVHIPIERALALTLKRGLAGWPKP
jgi:hypothetical protein